MAQFSPTYNPASVMLGSGGRAGSPYIMAPRQGSSQASTTPSTTIGAESVRSTGTGPFDPAYRQNLATYAGGQFMRPGGNLSFNPTDFASFPGAPTGGGSAPLAGMPTSLLGQALSGNPFSVTPPQPQGQSPAPQTFNDSNYWIKQYLQGGSTFGLPGSIPNVNGS